MLNICGMSWRWKKVDPYDYINIVIGWIWDYHQEGTLPSADKITKAIRIFKEIWCDSNKDFWILRLLQKWGGFKNFFGNVYPQIRQWNYNVYLM